MQALDLAQKIKIVKMAALQVPFIRASAEPYNPEKPTIFDSEITQDTIHVNGIINGLLGVIGFLMRELLVSNTRFPQDTWRKLQDVRKLVLEQRNTITGR